jgi:predicted transcriptional regulator
MATSKIKNIIHESIENIDDEDFLVAVKQILDRKYTSAEEPKLADWQIDRIKEGKKEIGQGNYITNEQADKLVDKWLSK